MSALPIEVVPTTPPSGAVLVLGQRVEVGPSDWSRPVTVLVGIWPGGAIGALRGAPSMTPLAPAVPPGFSPLAVVTLQRCQAFVQHHDIELIDP